MIKEIIIEIETSFGDVKVEKCDQVYTVSVNDVIKHTPCSADDVIRALGNYLHGK